MADLSMLVQTVAQDNSIDYKDADSVKIGIKNLGLGANCLNITREGNQLRIKFDYPVVVRGKVINNFDYLIDIV